MLEREQELARKHQVVVALSATVYDRQFTLLRGFGKDGGFRAVSNVDFHFLAGLGWIETGDTLFSLIMGLGNETAEALAMGEPRLTEHVAVARAQLPSDRAAYLVIDGALPAELGAALDALHGHFDAHRESLVAAFHERQAAQAAREREARENPPPPRDSVIRFWAGRNSIYQRLGK